LERICKEVVMALGWRDRGKTQTSVRIEVSHPIQVPTPFFIFFNIIVG
jgi:hypothetical protein